MTEGNMIVMDRAQGSTATDDSLSDDIDADAQYFTFHDLTNYFPTLKVSSDNAPLGNSGKWCIHLRWIKKEMSAMLDMYKHV